MQSRLVVVAERAEPVGKNEVDGFDDGGGPSDDFDRKLSLKTCMR